MTDAPSPDLRPYHHGNLRAGLLAAAEAELVAVGVEAFSLRAVAKRAGVSHAAPAHHFGDARGLLTALCAEGFRRLLACQTAREAQAARAPRAQLIAAGLGYIDFALTNPALFRLMFSSGKPDREASELVGTGRATFAHLVAQVASVGGDIGTMASGTGHLTPDIAVTWAIAHGLADLMGARPMQGVASLPGPERDAFMVQVLDRALPGATHAADA